MAMRSDSVVEIWDCENILKSISQKGDENILEKLNLLGIKPLKELKLE